MGYISFRHVKEILVCLLHFPHLPRFLHTGSQQLNNAVQEDIAKAYGAPEDNHTLGNVGNGLGHEKYETPLLDLRVVLVSHVEHHEQVKAHGEKDGDRVDGTACS